MLRLRTLGELRLLDDAGETLAGGRKELVLLAYLACHTPRPVARPELATLLWGEREERRARHSLRQALVELKRMVGPTLEVSSETVRLPAGVVDVDVVAVTADVSEGRLAEAVDRAEGEFLAGLEDLGSPPYRQWLEEQRAGLRRQLEWAIEELTLDAQRRGAWDEMEKWAQRWTRLAPLSERPHVLRMEALERSGRAAEALGQHSRLIARLQEELGVGPTPGFVRLGEQIERRSRLRPVLTPSQGSAALFTPDLVGREEAVGDLESAWQAVRGGVSAVLVIEGESGMGKTRICDEFLRDLAASGPHVLLRASAVGAPAWATARELLAGVRAAPGLSGSPDRSLADLSPLVPSLRERFPELPPSQGRESTRASALVQVLGDIAVEAPVLLFVDDALEADAESLRLLLALARQPPPAGVLLLLTVDRWDGTSPLAALRHAPDVRRIRLQPLDVREVDALVASMLALPDAERAALSQRLHAETGGNPFFAAEIVATLVDEGRLAPGDDGYWHFRTADMDATLPLPASVREAIRRRLDRLDETARRAAVTAAGMDERFTREAVAGATGFSAARALAAVDELIGRRLLRQARGAAGTLEFSHPLVRRTALDLPEARSHARPASAPDRVAPLAARPDHTPARRWWRRTGISPWAVLTAATLVVLGSLLSREAGSSTPVLAVGAIHGFGAADDSTLAGAVPDMLATKLAAAKGLHILSRSRFYPAPGGGEATPTDADLMRAAAAAGATELLEGQVLRQADGRLHLGLRLIDLRTGRLRAAYTAEGADIFELTDAAATQLAGRRGRPGR